MGPEGGEMKQLSVGLVIMARMKFRYHLRIGGIGHGQDEGLP